MPKISQRKTAQVIDIFSRKQHEMAQDERIIRISPENDGLSMLYGNDSNPGKLFSIKILGWGLKMTGEVVGLVPWLNRIMPCPELNDPLNGHWEGYYNVRMGRVFYEAPRHKKLELREAERYYQADQQANPRFVQEIPDTIGTHAILAGTTSKKFIIQEVFSWRLVKSGNIQGMLIEPAKVKQTPVLVGDRSLYVAQDTPGFKYFFQYRIANKIKHHEPEAMEAIALLMDP